MARTLAAAAACAAAMLAACAAGAAAPEGKYFKLSDHSFTASIANPVENWLSSAASMPLRKRVMLMPSVANRHGLLWNKKPMRTKAFEVRVKIKATAAPKTDGVVAFWLGPDDFAASYNEHDIVTSGSGKDWAAALEKQGFSLLSNKASFRGLGVFLIADGKDSRIASVWHNGESPLTLDDVRKGAAGLKVTTFDWITEPIELVVDATSKGSVVVSTTKGSGKRVLLSVDSPAPAIGDASFFGLSGFSGTTSPLAVDVTGIESHNADLTKIGEDTGEALHGSNAWSDVLASEKIYIDQESQMYAVKRLTKLLEDHISSYTSVSTQLKVRVADVSKRLDGLGQEFGKFVQETKAFDFDKGTWDSEVLRSHIQGVSTLISHSNGDKLHKLHSETNAFKQVHVKEERPEAKNMMTYAVGQAMTLEEHAARGTYQTSFLLVLVMLTVGVLAMLFWKRMRYYEKKHYV